MALPSIVALGDSLTQGFQNGAMYRPKWSFPAILARSLGHQFDHDLGHGSPPTHRVPAFPGAGHPLNLEHFVRHLGREIGDSISTQDWLLRMPTLVPAYVDMIEDFYERGPGARPTGADTYFHNLAAWGFRVHEATSLTPQICAALVKQQEGCIKDAPLGLPSSPMYRTAQWVLNPAGVSTRAHATMIDNLRALAAKEPIDLLTVWLGANDCLGAVLDMNIEDMPGSYEGADPIARRAFNLTSAQQFRRDYARLVEEIAAILADNPGRGQVYVGTVPHVTILPLLNGLGRQEGKYYERYGRFFRNEQNQAGVLARTLTRAQVMHIDERIDAFNDVICSLTAAQGWTLVDIAKTFEQLAVKRNDHHTTPEQPLRDYLVGDHPLLELERLPSILAYTVQAGPDGARRSSGGLVSLDNAHPSTIGYGLMAERFLQEIQARNPDDQPLQAAGINWDAVIRHDTLEANPPALWDQLMRHAEQWPWLWDALSAAMARRVA